MVCNCKCNNDKTTIKFIRGTTCNLLFKFNVPDLSGFEGVNFTIRKDYESVPIIDKTITGLSGDSVEITLNPTETNLFDTFLNGQNSSQYIWGLDLIIDDTQRLNIFPKTGNAAPICVVYKHVDVEE